MARVHLGDTRGIKVLKRHENWFIGVRVDITRKTTLDGKVRYAVVVYNINTGRPYRIKMCEGVGTAYNTYKKAIA